MTGNSQIVVKFAGFRRKGFAGKIHEVLGSTPKSEQEISRETGASATVQAA